MNFLAVVAEPVSEAEGIKTYFAGLSSSSSILFSAPFVILLAGLAILPLFFPHFWEKNKNKGLVAFLCGLPAVLFFLQRDWHLLVHTLLDYAAFIALLGSLFTISGGIYIRGSFAGRPAVNTAFLLIGALLANFIGTTGASMLLIRPLLRANKVRTHKSHIVIFFIFIVSNCAGLLTPLGDPPLFLGFLNGISFGWTLRLLPEWGLVVGSLLVIFYLLDLYQFEQEKKRDIKEINQEEVLSERFGIEGQHNFVFLFLIIGGILFSGNRIYPTQGEPILGEPYGAVMSKVFQVAWFLLVAAVSYKFTLAEIYERNHFNFAPITEVAILFAGIFAAMVPALLILETQGGKLGVNTPAQFYWLSGVLSSFLDNAPTYLTFTSLAKGALGLTGPGLAELMHHPVGATYLKAVSCGAVMMGANTYIGNGPNFMVKAIAEHAHVKMPGFFGYMLWSVCVLIPLFMLVTRLVFV